MSIEPTTRTPRAQRRLLAKSASVALGMAAFLLAAGLILAAGRSNARAQQEASSGKLRLATSAFKVGGAIPKKFTCDGADTSPALDWNDPPPGTRSFALIADDPDAPGGTFTHWLVYDLPAGQRRLPEGIARGGEIQGGGLQGVNDFQKTGYAGPCPPPGKAHRYYFRLYALDGKVNLRPAASRQELEPALQGHVLAHSEIMGKYQR